MELTQFDRLEEKIQRLIDIHAAAKKKNEELLDLIAQKDQDISRLKQELESATQSKERIGDRIETLLRKIEDLGSL